VTINGSVTGDNGATTLRIGEVMATRDASLLQLSGNVLPAFTTLTLAYTVAVQTPQGRRDTTVRIERVIRPTVTRADTVVTVVDHAGNATADGVTLGYFGYDAATFAAVDSTVVVAVRRAKAEGKRVSVIPETDELGSAEYNQQLRRQRAAAALQLLGLTPADVTLQVDQQPSSPATTPMERVARRRVSIRITDR
jgi:outer membrane protein OmpA-like peptidoglycan-associated protein